MINFQSTPVKGLKMRNFLKFKNKNNNIISVNHSVVNSPRSFDLKSFIGNVFNIKVFKVEHIQGKGIPKTIPIDLSGFDSIAITSVIQVEFVTSEKTAISLTADSDVLDLIELSVIAGKLVIGVSESKGFSSHLPVVVSIENPSLKEIEVSSLASFTATDLKEDHILINVSDVGRLSLQGEVNSLDIHASDYSRVNASKLTAGDLLVRACDDSKVSACAQNRINIFTSNESSISVQSKPSSIA